MGFGILLIGYALAFAFSLSPYYFFADIFGGLIMAYAFLKLSAFHIRFRPAGITAVVYSAVSMISMLGRLKFVEYSPLISKLAEAAVIGCILVLHYFMFAGIIALTKEIELPKITLKAKRNLVVMILYYTFYTLSLLVFDRLIEFYQQIALLTVQFFTIFQIFWLLMNIILIGSCCKWIGIEGEESTKIKTNPTKLDEFKDKWSALEDRVFTPKEKRTLEVHDDNKIENSPAKKKKHKKKK